MISGLKLKDLVSLTPPSIDGITGNKTIADHWATLFESIFNKNARSDRDSLSTCLSQVICTKDLHDIVVSLDLIRDLSACLKRGKSDGFTLTSERIINASKPLEEILAPFSTACFQHGHIPKDFCDAIVQPIPKGINKNPAISLNYRGIALASPFSISM